MLRRRLAELGARLEEATRAAEGAPAGEKAAAERHAARAQKRCEEAEALLAEVRVNPNPNSNPNPKPNPTPNPNPYPNPNSPTDLTGLAERILHGGIRRGTSLLSRTRHPNRNRPDSPLP